LNGEKDLRFKFKSKKLQALYTEEKGAQRYPSEVVEAFFDVMAVIDAARNENDLYAFKSLHFEKLKGKRGKFDQRSVRLNNQYRLILTIEKDRAGNFILVINIMDYH